MILESRPPECFVDLFSYRGECMPSRFETEPSNDIKLVTDVLLGNEAAARMLVTRLAPIIRRVAGRYSSASLREDLIQEVWGHLWSRNCHVLQQWDQRGPLVHYIAVMASNRMRDRAVALAGPHASPLDDVPDPPDPDDPHQTLEVQQLAHCLERAKARLSQTYREMIRLRHELGLKHREIADQLGKTLGYVSTTLARAERYLREELMTVCADHLGTSQIIFREE